MSSWPLRDQRSRDVLAESKLYKIARATEHSMVNITIDGSFRPPILCQASLHNLVEHVISNLRGCKVARGTTKEDGMGLRLHCGAFETVMAVSGRSGSGVIMFNWGVMEMFRHAFT